jgi:diamine N-acetyltransferase
MATFEKAAVTDIPLIQELAHKIWYGYYPAIISVEQINYMLELMYGSATLYHELTSHVIYELVMDHQVTIGYLSYQYEQAQHRVKLNKLYLLPEYHGQGIGQSMLSHVQEESKCYKADQIYLTVNKNNEKAIKAYKKFGFAVTESIVNDIGGGHVMDDFIMTYEI